MDKEPKSVPQNELAARATSPLVLCLMLAAGTLWLYWPATTFEFSHHDDLQYYVQNGVVQDGLSWNGIKWAFTTGWASNWHPLTWISLMVDADLSSGPTDVYTPHFTNMLFHAANAILLFALLRQMTGSKWRSFFAAGLFAMHPLNVESVAWVAERKNVLCMFFSLLSLMAYAEAVRSDAWQATSDKTVGKKCDRIRGFMDSWIFGFASGLSTIRRSSRFLWLALFVFALALMSKPMAVTLPLLLLLLDAWPFRRTTGEAGFISKWNQLLIEKIPFVVLSLAACVVTFLVQKHGHAVQTAEHFPLLGRLENAFVSPVKYLGKMFWPVDLAVYYPHPGHWPAYVWGLSAATVGLTSLGVIWFAKRFPYLAMGWFWFLAALIPVLGLVQAGTQSMADRYAYLPMIGISIAIIWGAGELLKFINLPRVIYFSVGGILLLTSAVVARHQLNFWQNDGTLFGRALAVTTDNPVAEVTYGTYLDKIGKHEDAMNHYRAALAVDPNDKAAHFDLGNDLDDLGKTDEAIDEYHAAIRADPTFYSAAYNLALVLERLGRRDEAIAEYKAVLQMEPSFVDAKQHLQALGGDN